MGNTERNETYDIEQSLLERPEQFSFFQAIRLLECKTREKPLLGRGVRSADDPVRLEQSISLAFAPATISAYQYREGSPVPHLSTRFFGLFGPNGALPLHLTEYVFQRVNHYHDSTFLGFANLFQHRMLSLFYRAWADAQPTVNLDRPEEDRFKQYVGSFLGIAPKSIQNRDEVGDYLKLHYAGHFSCQTQHVEGLTAIIEGFFGLNVEIEEFIGEWLTLPEDSICRLGETKYTSLLGSTVILGERIWTRQNKFRIVLGAMDLDSYRLMLPGGQSLKKLVAIVKHYIGIAMAWDVQLILKRAEVPEARLGDYSQLGWTSWLGQRKTQYDADDLVLSPVN